MLGFVGQGIPFLRRERRLLRGKGIKKKSFVEFYLLIIIYSSLTLGRNGAMIAAAFCVVLYTGLISTTRLGLISLSTRPEWRGKPWPSGSRLTRSGSLPWPSDYGRN